MRVLNCLGRHMPFWDRKIEIVVNSHPQLDHYGGLIDVFKDYDVQTFIATPLDSSSQEYQLLKKMAKNVVSGVSGKSIRYGMIYYDIFFPTAERLIKDGWDGVEGVLGSFSPAYDYNDYSIQAILRFGKFDALLTGDMGKDFAGEVLESFKDYLVKNGIESVEYIKTPHHGSKNSLTQEYLDLIRPEIAVIQVGKNSYGHPHKEILDLFANLGIDVYRTDQLGDVIVEVDKSGKARIITNNLKKGILRLF